MGEVERPCLAAWQGYVFGLGMELSAESWDPDPVVTAAREHAWRARGEEFALLLQAVVVEALNEVALPLSTLVFEETPARFVVDGIVGQSFVRVPEIAAGWAEGMRAVVMDPEVPEDRVDRVDQVVLDVGLEAVDVPDFRALSPEARRALHGRFLDLYDVTVAAVRVGESSPDIDSERLLSWDGQLVELMQSLGEPLRGPEDG